MPKATRSRLVFGVGAKVSLKLPPSSSPRSPYPLTWPQRASERHRDRVAPLRGPDWTLFQLRHAWLERLSLGVFDMEVHLIFQQGNPFKDIYRVTDLCQVFNTCRIIVLALIKSFYTSEYLLQMRL